MSGLSRRKVLNLGAAGAAGTIAAVATEKATAKSDRSTIAQSTRSDSNRRFDGKVVLITGATSGIGEATARAFAKEGAIVHFCGRRERLGEQVASSIQNAGGKASYQRADVKIDRDVKAFVDTCVKRYGKIDIAFNNAGIETRKPAPLAEQSLADWNDVMTTNVTGYFLAMKYEIPVMLKNQSWGAYNTRGIIINNASVSGHVGFANIGSYSTSKHAVIGLTKCAALDYGNQGIRITSISPGGVDTPMRWRALDSLGIDRNSPPPNIVRRINTPEEMARVVMLLSTEETTSIMGTDLDVTTGMLSSCV